MTNIHSQNKLIIVMTVKLLITIITIINISCMIKNSVCVCT